MKAAKLIGIAFIGAGASLGMAVFAQAQNFATPANGGLLKAIQSHAGPGSEANAVISLFDSLSSQQKQDLLNFLRSL